MSKKVDELNIVLFTDSEILL